MVAYYMFALAMLFNLAPAEVAISGTSTSPLVEERATSTPFFSQFEDISSKFWGKLSCGIASLAMVTSERHSHAKVLPDALLASGRAMGGYSPSGWIRPKLVELAGMHGLHGEAIASLKEATLTGPVLASVHYKLAASNPIPHLIVVCEVSTSTVTISDPANTHSDEIVTLKKFEKAWKKRYISFSESTLAQN